ncbi:MAG: ABC transporter permease [Burkholderiaceae bacterium]
MTSQQSAAAAARRWQIELRPRPPLLLRLLSPVVALFVTAISAFVLMLWMNKDPLQGLMVFFVTPMENLRGWGEIGLRMTPLLLCALGLALCYRANVWNIGAEGQLVAGGIAAGAVGLLAGPDTFSAYFVLVLLAGMLGGLCWGALIAVLRDRFNANEILVSLMLVYIAQFFLMYLVHGPLKDPNGYNFPYSAYFESAAMVPHILAPTRLNIGFILALIAALILTVFLGRSVLGYRLQVAGMAPRAARYAGFSERQGIWISLTVCGALAGLAGALEVAGPIGQLTPSISPGYGFAAIIVAWLGRLNPLGCIAAAFVMSVVYIGGELAQSRLGLPNAISGVLQGVLLLSLLTVDSLIGYRLRRTASAASGDFELRRTASAASGDFESRRTASTASGDAGKEG